MTFYLEKLNHRRSWVRVTDIGYYSTEYVKREFKRLNREGAIKSPLPGHYRIVADNGEPYFIYDYRTSNGRFMWKWAPKKFNVL